MRNNTYQVLVCDWFLVLLCYLLICFSYVQVKGYCAYQTGHFLCKLFICMSEHVCGSQFVRINYVFPFLFHSHLHAGNKLTQTERQNIITEASNSSLETKCWLRGFPINKGEEKKQGEVLWFLENRTFSQRLEAMKSRKSYVVELGLCQPITLWIWLTQILTNVEICPIYHTSYEN